MYTDINNLLIVIDSCAFGIKIQFLLDRIKISYDNKNIYILDWDCYEQYLLQSANIVDNLKEDIAVLDYPIHMDEVRYYDILKEHLLNYSKGGRQLPVCLSLSKHCTSLDCNYFNLCTCKVDHIYNFDRRSVYIHEPLNTKFSFQPSDKFPVKDQKVYDESTSTALYFGKNELNGKNPNKTKHSNPHENKPDETGEKNVSVDNQSTL